MKARRILFLPLHIQGTAPGESAETDTALMARWLPEIASTIVRTAGVETVFARMVGQTKEGHPVLLNLGKPVPDDQARGMGRQHQSDKVVSGSIEDGEKTTIRLQVLDVARSSARLVDPVSVSTEKLHTLPERIADTVCGALEVERDADALPEELRLPSPLAFQASLAARDVIVRLELGVRPPAERIDEVLRPFFDLADAMPGAETVHGGLATVLGKLQDPRTPQLAVASRDALERALELFPESPTLHHLTATYHASFARPPATDTAEEELRRAMELDQGYLPARFALADLCRFLGRADDEKALYEELVDHEELGVVVRDRYGVALAARGEGDEAVEQWTTLLERDATYTPALRNMALLHQQRGDTDGARKFLERAVAHPERFPTVLYEYALLLQKQGQAATAIPYLQRHLRHAPRHVPSMVDLGNAHRALGDAAAARQAYQQAARLDPRGPAGADALLALFGMERPGEATELDTLTQGVWEDGSEAHLSGLEQFLSDHGELGLWQPWYALGVGRRNATDWDGAEKALAKALELCPSQPDVQTALGTCHLHFGRVSQAAGLIAAAVQARPQDPSVLAAYGLANHMAQRLDEAERLYRQALSLSPEDPTILQYMDGLERWRAGERVPLI